MAETNGQLGRSSLTPSNPSSQTQLPGTIRKKNPGYTGSRSFFSQLTGRQPGTVWWQGASPSSTDSGTTEAENRSGNLPGTIRPATLSDSTPISTNKTPGASSGTVPASYEAGNIWTSIKSGLTTFMPALLVIGSIVLGIVIIKSAGGGGRRR